VLIFLEQIVIRNPKDLFHTSSVLLDIQDMRMLVPHRCQTYALTSPSIPESTAQNHHSMLHSILSCPRDSLVALAPVQLLEGGFRIPQSKQAMTINLSGLHDRIRVVFEYTPPVPRTTFVLWTQPIGPQTGTATKKEVLINFHEFLVPEAIFIQNTAGQYIYGDATGKVLNGFPGTY
jgi:hypothetical protein